MTLLNTTFAYCRIRYCFSLRVPIRHYLSPFFFYASGHPRALPSFPTRRSSDPSAVDPSRRAATESALAYMGLEPGMALAGLDRKSTRLNSSHLGISYAVFCLKKKRKTLRLSVWQPPTKLARAL